MAMRMASAHSDGRCCLNPSHGATTDGRPPPEASLRNRCASLCGGAAPAGQLILSDALTADRLGVNLATFAPQSGYLGRFAFGPEGMSVRPQGIGPGDSSPLAFVAGDQSYEVSVDLALEGDCLAGLLLFYDERLFCGVGSERDRLHAYKLGGPIEYPSPGEAVGPVMSLRLVNVENVVSFYIGRNKGRWRKLISLEVSGYNHNMADGFMSLRPALFASGRGEARFHNLRYRAFDTPLSGCWDARASLIRTPQSVEGQK
jgi:xylan 1,4-beta-xylosidase